MEPINRVDPNTCLEYDSTQLNLVCGIQYILLSVTGLWNLYIVTLLLMLARSTSGSSASGLSTAGGNENYRVQPVAYTCRSLDIDFHQNAVYSDGECVLDSLTSNHFSSGEESNLKRRQSSEDFLEMQAARRRRQGASDYYHHHYDEFSDDFDDDEEAMVDEEDPLEMARQGTVHLWENEEVICHGISDAFIATISSNSSPNEELGGRASDDAVLYRD